MPQAEGSGAFGVEGDEGVKMMKMMKRKALSLRSPGGRSSLAAWRDLNNNNKTIKNRSSFLFP